MYKIIVQRVEDFVKELSKAVKITEKISINCLILGIDERSILKPNSYYDSLSGTRSVLYKSYASSSLSND